MSSKNLSYPKTGCEKTWIKYLHRRLKCHEKDILSSYLTESNMNRKLEIIQKKCANRDLFVPILTRIDGDCLFESLNYHGIGNDILSLRNGIAYLLYIFKNKKNLLPNIDLTLQELFTFSNDIEYVYEDSTNKYNNFNIKRPSKYTYDIMCQDLCDEGSWSKLPTQLILTLVSYVFKVKIEIISSTNQDNWEDPENHHQTIINSYENTNVKTNTIYLGLLGELHYVPIDIIDEDTTKTSIKYVKAEYYFHNWAKKIEKHKKIYESVQ